MNTKDWKLKPVHENYNFQDHVEDEDYNEEEEEEEEALSLCDLASDDYWGDEFSKENQTNYLDDQEMFEFFSVKEDLSPKNDNIIFCGKLIQYKGEKKDEKNYQDQHQPKETKKIIGRKFSWKSFSFNKSRNTSSSSSSLKIQQQKSYRACKTFPESSSENKENRNCDFPAKKVSLLSSPSKSRWYLFAFGVGKYPMEIKLSDIKTRQSKLSDSKMRQSIKNPARIFRSDDRREKSWWGLFKNFGCRSSHGNAMVKVSLGCIA